jgi:hypothetical protein
MSVTCRRLAAAMHRLSAAHLALLHTTYPAAPSSLSCLSLCCSFSVLSSDQAYFLVMGCVGSSHEATTLPNVVTPVVGSGSSVERVIAAVTAPCPLPPGSGFCWSAEDGMPAPSDWAALAAVGIRHLHGVPLRGGSGAGAGGPLLGVLNLGFKGPPCLDGGLEATDPGAPDLFGTYLGLVSATLTAVARDPGLSAAVALARDVAAATSLDGMMSSALSGTLSALTRLKGLSSSAAGPGSARTWLRLALISGDKSAAALFDDLGQVCV